MSSTSTSTSTTPAPRILGSPRVVEMLGNRLELLVEQQDFPRASVVQSGWPGEAWSDGVQHH